jgi:hypothetical protein
MDHTPRRLPSVGRRGRLDELRFTTRTAQATTNPRSAGYYSSLISGFVCCNGVRHRGARAIPTPGEGWVRSGSQLHPQRRADSKKAGMIRPRCSPWGVVNRRRSNARFAYWLYEPVCCVRVASASPAIVLLAFATGAMAAVRLRAAMAARIMFFIGVLHLLSGEMSGFDGQQMDLCAMNDNRGSQYWIYASGSEVARSAGDTAADSVSYTI